MSAANDATHQLWRFLKPRLHEIGNRATDDVISMRSYAAADMPTDRMFAPTTVFEKWAAVEVTTIDRVPDGMRPHTLAGGDYAVFVHEGPASTFVDTMRYIFLTWLPASGYQLDHREQFERLAETWNAEDPDGREEIWLPIR